MQKGPALAFSDEMHAGKYRGPNETFRDYAYRCASPITDGEEHYRHFASLLLHQFFLPAGRIQASVGSLREVTPYNCFVSGAIEDSMVDGHGSIMGRLTEAAATMRMGGGIGYDFSPLRPFKDLIRTQQTYASGPISFMSIYDATCRTIASAGHRRGAQMAVLRIDHPDIEAFINAKHPTAEMEVLWNLVEANSDPALRQRAHKALQKTLPLSAFNTSIAVTDEFMECLASGKSFPLQFGGVKYREVDPAALWDMVMRSTWDWAEPGVLFVDTINRMNNLHYCETIAATNPCGEQPLPPYGACLLGSINLPKYLVKLGRRYVFDWDRFAADIPTIIRAMDNVIDLARYPIYEQKKEAIAKRRMGIGVTGLANCVEALTPDGASYGDEHFLYWTDAILRRMTRECYLASIALAKEKGAFPMFNSREYLKSAFVQALDDEVQTGIKQYGIRNSHLTSIAPTGTISLCADNVSSGLEPVFAYEFDRQINAKDGLRTEGVEDYGVRVLGNRGKVAEDVTIKEHLGVLLTAQANVDSAVSKTCNVGDDVSWEEFKKLYQDAHAGGAKGCTTFRPNGKRLGIFTVKDDDTQSSSDDLVASACKIDDTTGRRECE